MSNDIKKEGQINPNLIFELQEKDDENILIVDEQIKKPEQKENEIQPDERFYKPKIKNKTQREIEDEKRQQKYRERNEQFKEQLRDEEKQKKIKIFKNKVKEFLIGKGFAKIIDGVALNLNILLNFFTIGCLVVSILFTLYYVYYANPVMSIVSCVIMIGLLYLNKNLE
jgi:hypothetical protein